MIKAIFAHAIFWKTLPLSFDIQGLELDWCLVDGNADYRYRNGQFEHWKLPVQVGSNVSKKNKSAT